MGSIYSARTILDTSSKNSVMLYYLLHRIYGPELSHVDENVALLFIVFCVVVADMSIICVSWTKGFLAHGLSECSFIV